jgi:serine/threonine protein kinase
MLRHHPHVITYNNCFLTPNFLVIVGECANIGTLRNFLKRFARASTPPQFQQSYDLSASAVGIPAAPARFLFQQLVILLDYCRRINVSISGSLNPDNVVVCWNGSAPIVKIAATGQSGALSPVRSLSSVPCSVMRQSL